MITVYNMDVLKALRMLPDESVDLQITSPPYWGLRDYGKETNTIWGGDPNCEHEWVEKTRKNPLDRGGKGQFDEYRHFGALMGEKLTTSPIQEGFCKKCGAWYGQLGLEPTFDLYIEHLLMVFDEVKRVLKKDGTCWVNLGDTYWGSGAGTQYEPNLKNAKESYIIPYSSHITKKSNSNYQSKCLCMIPERFALGMINHGWILRNKIIWHKPNHMPTSTKDRFANSWEYLFFFSKSKKYYFDLDAVRVPSKTGNGISHGIANGKMFGGHSQATFPVSGFGKRELRNHPLGKNPGDVISEEYKGNYEKGTILKNEKGMSSLMHYRTGKYVAGYYNPKGKNPGDFWSITTKPFKEAHFAVFPEQLVERPIRTSRKNAVILDVFAGSGTTLKVARDLGRDAIGIEIQPKYVEIIKKRLFNGNQPLFNNFKIIKD